MPTNNKTYVTEIILNSQQAQNEIKKVKAQADDLRKKVADATAAHDVKAAQKYGKELDKIERKYQTMITSQERIANTLRDISQATPKDLRDTIKAINRELNSGNVKRGSEEWRALQEQLGKAKAELRAIRQESEAAGAKSGLFSKLIPEGVMGRLSQISQVFIGVKSMVLTAIAAIQQAWDGAKWFIDYNRQIEEANRLTREFTNLTGEALNRTREEIQAVADVMGKNYNDVLSTVNTLMAQYQITASEAIDVVRRGFQSGADLSGNMLQQINQFAPAFHDAGISAEELVGIIQQTRSGIFSVDGLNIIQMGSKRIREMGKSTAEAIDAIGMSSTQVADNLRNGTQSTMDVIRDISTHLKQLPNDSQEVGNVLKDVFGRQGANAGLQLIEQLDTMETDLDKLIDTTGEYGRLQQEEIDAQNELNRAMTEMFGLGNNGFEEMTAKAKILCMEGLVKIIDYCLELYDKLGIIRAAVQAVRVVFDTTFKVIEAGFWLIIDVVDATAQTIKGLAEMVEGLFTIDFGQIEQGWNDMLGGITNAANHFADKATDIGQRWGDNLVDAINQTVSGREIAEPDGTMLPEVTVTAKRPKRKQSPKPTSSNKGGKDKAASDAYQAETKLLEVAYKRRQLVVKQQLADGLITERDYQEQSYNLEMEHLAAKVALQEKYGKETADTQLQMLDKTMQQAKLAQQRSAQEMQEQLKTAEDAYNSDRLELAKQRNRGEIATDEDYQRQLKQLELDYYNQRLSILKLFGADTLQVEQSIEDKEIQDAKEAHDKLKKLYEKAYNKADTLQDQRDLAKMMYEEQLIDFEEYQDRMTDIEQREQQKRADIRQQFYQMGQQLLSSFSAYAQACSDLETAKITADYDRQIEAAGKNTRKRERLEKERDEKLRKLKTKSNERAMKIEIAQALATTAANALSAFGAVLQPQMPWTVPLAYAAAAAATINGMMQIATIKKQHQAEAAGYYEGGFTGGKRYRKEAGVVHEGEFVANHQAVQNPDILPALRLIDQAQKNNTVSNLKAEDIARSVGVNPTVNVAAPIVNVAGNPEVTAALDDLNRSIALLNAALAEGVHMDTEQAYKELRRFQRLKDNV